MQLESEPLQSSVAPLPRPVIGTSRSYCGREAIAKTLDDAERSAASRAGERLARNVQVNWPTPANLVDRRGARSWSGGGGSPPL